MTPLNDIPHMAAEPLAKHTTFRVGGPAKEIFEPETEEQIFALRRYFVNDSLRTLVIGNGSNILFSDRGFDGVIIKIGDRFSDFTIDGTMITACAGAKLSKLAAAARDAGLTGLEFAAGIPGTVGGAVCMNAGAYGGEMKDVVSSVTLVDERGEQISLTNEELCFGYRTSAVRDRQIVTRVCLSLSVGNREEIAAAMEELKKKRIEKQPLEYPSAGSTFKRPEGFFAGKLIEDSGLKGYRVGGAMVSEKHAGFVINYDHATAEDIRTLIADVQRIVLEKQGVELTPEVKIIE